MMTNRFDDIPKEDLERLRRIAKKMQTKSLPYFKWGETTFFQLNGKSVLHSQWIARSDETAACYCKFINRKLIEKGPTVVLLETGLPPQPDDYNDREKWIESDYGYKKTPWQLQYEIPLQQVETGELALFSSFTEWGRATIGATIEYFSSMRRRPIVQLEKREQPGNGGKTIIVGALDIVAPDEGDDGGIDLTKDAINNDPISSGVPASKRNGGGDMGDEIPF